MFNIGIDAGGVLFQHRRNSSNSTEDTSSTIWNEGALDSLKKLKTKGHRLYLISFAGKKTGELTKQALRDEASEYIDEEDMYIVNHRLKKGKLCKQLGIDVMLDDRPDVLEAVLKDSQRTKCYLFGTEPSQKFTRVLTWDEFVNFIQ